ncbi:N-acyl homoserine lactonase family protein [Vibrio sp. JC009]|uniref:N-acyl homoserine lactonase family protein n=1 Tax=Vibrio sp. JC009 TaxID=2912314 RepID=UPI0023B0191C|nr:N-acyl homoserine lactonase family protein [Vibrio sp. JC009]WED23808.1 N-acyl homoserine lactonase family protein [Vibrio sp. JC009]
MVRQTFSKLALASAIAVSMFSCVTAAEQDNELRLYELDGGSLILGNNNLLSDTDSFSGSSMQMKNPAYLIKHGENWVLWDTGLPGYIAEKKDGVQYGFWKMWMNKTLPEQLNELELTPGDIDYVILSHTNMDHTGNTNLFKNAILIIQEEEYEVLLNEKAAQRNHLAPELLSWFISGGGKDNVRLLHRDEDIFSDGALKSIFLPGHTPGHMALLVNLKEAGPVILAGDLWHSNANRLKTQLPDFNSSRSDTLASFERMEEVLSNTGAKLIIQHEVSPEHLLPDFPAYLD